jgi:hypothetical protein
MVFPSLFAGAGQGDDGAEGERWHRRHDAGNQGTVRRPGANVIKLFYGRKLRLFIISLSVCP